MHVAECTFQPGAGVHDLWARGGDLVLCAAQTCSVIVDSKVAVGRRRRHQADMRRRRPQGQRSPLWPQSAAAWPLVPRSGTLECATLDSVRTVFQPYVTHMSILLVQRAANAQELFARHWRMTAQEFVTRKPSPCWRTRVCFIVCSIDLSLWHEAPAWC